jgi:demethylmenaquinone methyltransferase/2-methoxy-6-polyprenyl-1,4-benzoquinol methylase
MLREQIEYYRARAAEYDEWFLREGRYDRGPQHREAWFNEVGLVETALRNELPRGEVLELACGTGLWTRHLVDRHARVVAVDASPEVIAINRQRVQSDRVNYVVADVFAWHPESRFDAVFFGFWLSHVPREQFEPFWKKVRASLKDGGRVFFVDSLLEQSSTAHDHDPLDQSGFASRSAERRPCIQDREGLLRTGRTRASLERTRLAGVGSVEWNVLPVWFARSGLICQTVPSHQHASSR